MMDSPFHPSTPVHSDLTNATRLMWHAELLAGAVFCLALPAHVEVTPDNTGLDLPGVKTTNNQPISKPTRGATHNERIKPSFDYRDNGGTQIEEYRFRKGQTPNIHVKSGADTSYNPNKPEDSPSHICKRGDIGRAPSINVLRF